jgi:hypothetical protein
MNLDQGYFNFDAAEGESGYQKWQEELDARKKRFESHYGIILGSKVRITLRNENQPIDGIITLCDSKEPKNRNKLPLRISSRIITMEEIESITRL